MKVKTPYKTVMFYGNILHIPINTNWLAVDSDGRLMAYAEKPHVENDVWRAKDGVIWELFLAQNLKARIGETLLLTVHMTKNG